MSAVSFHDEIAALATQTTAELAATFERLHGRPPRYRSLPWLRKRIAHALQTAAFGGLSRRARAAVDELAAQISLPAASRDKADSPHGELRSGTMLQRSWRGRQIRVLVTDDGFEWDGRRFGSLSAAALAVTGAKWSGALFFGLRQRSSKS